MTARNREPVIVAGGGIGGLAAALALARKGFRSIVLEQAPRQHHASAARPFCGNNPRGRF